ncbi:lipoprotein [Falsibacillus pallidus]|uniref:Lipoprotein n=1 Tax=Falsibacillus pallidus TaxID=493781 RepID=A0A370G0B3_9BACI|nr:lipoprotein [Falsibacillus pallidus]RDI36329.1 hypothetical protein DFR59_1324 [Falsibacillus pallidus]
MKKYIVLILSLFFLTACTSGKTQSLEEFWKDTDIKKVDEIVIQDGTSGGSLTITEQDQMDDLLSQIKDIEFTPKKNQEEVKGWSYAVTLFDGKKSFKFFTDKIGKTYYDSTPEILPIIEKYYHDHLPRASY